MSQPTTIQQPEQTQTPQSNSTWSCCGYWASTQSNESDHLAIIGNDRPTNKNRGKLPSVRIKLVLLGQSGVGKTSLVQRWVFDKFSPSQSRTVGVFNQGRDIEVNGQAVTVTLWDTAGQEVFKSIVPTYYRKASCALVVYDITNKASFGEMDYWVKELRRNGPEAVVVAAVGNKRNLFRTRQITESELEAYASSNQLDLSAEVSARDGEGVENVFMNCIHHCLDRGLIEEI